MPRADFVIGLDFDNTLVSYDAVMYQTAIELELISESLVVENKQQIRDFIRTLPEGEIKWQKLQAEVYGKRMHQAQLIKGVKEFLVACKDRRINTFIVSHKSKYAAQDKEGINLQHAAFKWMKQNQFFDQSGLGLSEDGVFFEETREQKVARIKAIACTHFIDDLEEVFLEKTFPLETQRILYASNRLTHRPSDTKIFASWDEIYKYFFDQQ